MANVLCYYFLTKKGLHDLFKRIILQKKGNYNNYKYKT